MTRNGKAPAILNSRWYSPQFVHEEKEPQRGYQLARIMHLASPPKPTVFISGVIARGDKDFPPAAAQVAHQKPHASMDKHPSPRTQHIQQPRK
ncbi:PREDICTED: death-associated protein 1 isoform X2 [Cercocebus atys]|uniref:death-associated protein 1 isoform X2 n=1 Tax=Cercocebus atys TaxID=9531 RepID=UPI0005F3F24B|nr:PREDICTED: death-associated protein 1 isoform X2 [Cercocebus atys]